jgi:hypothetical protein
MIKESIQQTIKLIEDLQRIDPAVYQDQKLVLDDLVRHMRLVIDSLERHQKVA